MTYTEKLSLCEEKLAGKEEAIWITPEE